MSAKRWLVERADNDFEDVGAESMTLESCGALRFWSGHLFEPRLEILYAPGTWLTVVANDDEEPPTDPTRPEPTT